MGLLNRTACAAFALTAAGASAHVVLQQRSAEVGTSYKAVFVVGHGCVGGHATTAITVRFPEPVVAVKPMPKAGWTIEVKRVPIDKPYEYYGRRVTDRVTEITWKGGSLPFDFYDEFTAAMRLPEKGAKVYFKVLQSCGDHAMDWADVPEAGKTTRDYKTPAAELDVQEKQAPAQADAHKH